MQVIKVLSNLTTHCYKLIKYLFSAISTFNKIYSYNKLFFMYVPLSRYLVYKSSNRKIKKKKLCTQTRKF